MGRRFGADGVRGIANLDLTPEVLLELGRALAGCLRSTWRDGLVVVGRDPRPSSEMLEAAFTAGLLSGGMNVTTVGVVPTAGIAFLTRHLGAAGGAVITASHNPLRDNGLKLFDGNGFKYTEQQEIELEERVESNDQAAPRPQGRHVGRLHHCPSLAELYVEHLVDGTPSLDGLTLTLDCANGASSVIAAEAYRRAGADVREIAGDMSGNLINCGVGATHPSFLKEQLRNVDGIGLAHDGDADRLIAFDESRRLVDGADMLAALAVAWNRQGILRHASVVTSSVTNSGLSSSLVRHGITVLTSSVGDRAVLKTMLDNDRRLGGEQYGHIIMLDHATTGDGILTALHLLGMVATTGRRLADLTSVWDRTPECTLDVSVPDRSFLETHPEVGTLVARERTLLGKCGRLLVRMSTIEAVVRIACEARTDEVAADVAGRVRDAITSAVNAQ